MRSKTGAAVMAALCPFPTKYKQVWHLTRGGKSLYAWKPMAPDGFVALGMMATSSDIPPELKAMRCVPESWCLPSKNPPFKIWDDTGAGGGKPGSIWVINSLDMVVIVAGHEAPMETFYELNSAKSFFVDASTLPKSCFSHTGGGAGGGGVGVVGGVGTASVASTPNKH